MINVLVFCFNSNVKVIEFNFSKNANFSAFNFKLSNTLVEFIKFGKFSILLFLEESRLVDLTFDSIAILFIFK